MVDHVALTVAVERNRRAREVHRAPACIRDDLDSIGIVDECRLERAGRGAEWFAALETCQRAADGGRRDEWLVALHIQNEVEVTKRRLGNDFGHTLGPRLVVR